MGIGEVGSLEIIRSFEDGYILDGKPEEIFLHKNEATQNFMVGDTVQVFVYRDHQGRIAATMHIPKIRPGVYGWTEVIKVLPERGVFVRTGLTKDGAEPRAPRHKSAHARAAVAAGVRPVHLQAAHNKGK